MVLCKNDLFDASVSQFHVDEHRFVIVHSSIVYMSIAYSLKPSTIHPVGVAYVPRAIMYSYVRKMLKCHFSVPRYAEPHSSLP